MRRLATTLIASLAIAASLLAASPAQADDDTQFDLTVFADAAPTEASQAQLLAIKSGNADTTFTGNEVLSGPDVEVYPAVSEEESLAGAPSDQYKIRNRWLDRKGFGVTQRWGPQGGFGFRHHNYDHNLSTRSVYLTTSSSDSRDRYVTGSKWEWYNYANRYTCRWYGCRLQERVKVIVPVDYRLLSDSSNFGVVTGYCAGYPGFCPSWVNDA